MTAQTASPPTDPLAMTDAEVAAIIPDARQAAENARLALDEAEADPGSVTPARFAELRAAAEHAELLVPVAERRYAEVQKARVQARKAGALARVRAEGPTDLDHTSELLARLDALDTALRAFCEAAYAHNERVTYWATEAGIAEGSRDAIAIGGKTWHHLDGGRLVEALVYRAMYHYPDEFLLTSGSRTITHDGDPYGPKRMGERLVNAPRTALDLHDLIRKDA
ncbi:hypothetical protein ACWCQP_39590 [Streptomyces chartreusis]